MSEKLDAFIDHIAEMLDDMSDLSEVWSKNRKRGRECPVVRAAIVTLAQQITAVVDEKQRETESWRGEIDKQRIYQSATPPGDE